MLMKPFKSFLFLIITLTLLMVIPLLSPDKKILISGYELRIFSLNFFAINKSETELKTEVQIKNALLNPEPVVKAKPENKKISVASEPSEIKTESFAKIETQLKNQLGFSEIVVPSGSSNQWAELSAKFSETELLERPLRILYYGDSQIENDRITSVFRKVLQERYGGFGRGLIPVENIYNSANNFIMTTSDNWESMSVIKAKQKQLDLGLLCEAFKIKYSAGKENSNTTSWVKIKSIENDVGDEYSVLSIFYRASGYSNVSVTLNTNQPVVKELTTNGCINELSFTLEDKPENVEIRFSTASEITVYGLNLESPTGIMVDNIALRGRSCPEFSKIDTTRLRQMAQLLNPSFVILQYGVNVVPNITSNYNFYKNQLNNELVCLREIIPDIPVLLVSVSDMAYKVGGLLESYPNLEEVLNTQKEVAVENGCAFWNLFESMGGKGSMISWVEKQPPLGNKDYVHYTSLGAEKVGNLFAHQFIKALELKQATALMANEP